jgi:hypothetical protein
MFLAPTVSSLRSNRAEREVSGWAITRLVPLVGLSKWAVNGGVFAELNFVAERAFWLGDKLRQKVADGFRQSWIETIALRENRDFSFRRRRRPIQTRRPRVGEPADQSRGVEGSTPLSGAHRASGP